MIEPLSPVRIMIVDDEPGMLRAMSRVLKPSYTIETCNDPTLAMELAAQFQPDIVILDIRMPKIDGFTLMRSLLLARNDLDVILVTGNFDEADNDLIKAIDDGAFFYLQKPIDRRVLLALVSRCVERRQLQEQVDAHLNRLEGELESARRFQMGLLPPLRQQHGVINITASLRSCSEVAGDFFDYEFIGADSVTFLIADVVGHGARAAMLTGLIKSAFRSCEPQNYGPLDIVRSIHAAIQPFNESDFLTAFCATITTTPTPSITYVNAGHPPVLIGSHDHMTQLAANCPIVCSIFPSAMYGTATQSMKSEDLVFAYSDGITESSGPDGMIGVDLLIDWIRELATRPADLIAKLDERVQAHSQHTPPLDDQTMMCVQLEHV